MLMLPSVSCQHQLCAAVNMLDGRDDIQRELHRLERWACANMMKCCKAKPYTWVRANPSTNIG